MKSILKFLGSSVLSALLVGGSLVAHMMYESSKYVPPPTLTQQLSNVVSIYSADGNVYCSGWVLKGTHEVVTARHCTDDVVQSMVVDFGDGKPHQFHVEKTGGNSLEDGPDLMTLTTNDTTVNWPVGLSVCKFKPYYGESLISFGGPLGYEKTISFGRVSNPSRDLTVRGAGDYAKDMVQYDGFLFQGSSGGAVLDADTGCVVGVAELIVPAVPSFPYPYGLNFLTPISDLDKIK